MDNQFEMSYFAAPITNKRPLRTLTLQQVAHAIRTPWLAFQTAELRKITSEAEARTFKGQHFPYVTPAGVFSYCNDQSLVRHSGMLCMDLDHIGDVDSLKQRLIADDLFQTLMAFRSPSGDGLKWFLRIDLNRCNHRQWFDAVRNYLMSMYGLSEKQADPSVRNESRACFLCYDPEVYVNPCLGSW
jgi:hypothetical protein